MWGGLILTMLSATSNLNAQIVNPILPDLLRTGVPQWCPCTPSNPPLCPTPSPTLNCDMIENPDGLIKTIVWDDHNTWDTTHWVSFWVEDYAGNSVQQTIPVANAYDPDVVLADDMNNPGVNYKLAIVFRQGVLIGTGGNVMLRIYNLTNVGTPAFTATLASANIISNTASSSPHIDMWADNLSLIYGNPSLHRFVMGWSDAASQNRFLTNEVLTPTLTPSFGVPTIVGSDPDVAAYTDVLNNQKHIVVANKTGNTLRQFDYNQTAGGFPLQQTLAGNAVKYPRIEAMSLWHPGLFPNATKWQVVSVLLNGAVSGWTIGAYNNNASYLISNPADSVDHFTPAVAAGIGLNSIGNVANRLYITGYYRASSSIATSNVYTREINAGTGALNSGNYYKVNMGNISMGHPIHYAVSSSSNTGKQILSVWHDNTVNIYYKLSPNAVAFKTTGVANIITLQQIKAYPNPATNTLSLSGLKNEEASYYITDLLGKSVQSGLTNNHTINTALLSVGIYTLQVKQGQKTTILKFSKQ